MGPNEPVESYRSATSAIESRPSRFLTEGDIIPELRTSPAIDELDSRLGIRSVKEIKIKQVNAHKH